MPRPETQVTLEQLTAPGRIAGAHDVGDKVKERMAHGRVSPVEDSRSSAACHHIPRMKVAVDELTKLFESVFARGQAGAPAQPNILAGADDEIDRLFQ